MGTPVLLLFIRRNLVTIEPSRRKVLCRSQQFSTKFGGYQADTLVHNLVLSYGLYQESRPVMKVSRIIVSPVKLLRSKWLSFPSVHEAKKLSHIDLKNLGQIFVLPVIQFFLSNDSFFLSGARSKSKKIESFWLKDLGQILVPPVIHFF